jgi:hypothetical protein
MIGIEREKVGRLPVWAWAVLSGFAIWLLYVFTLGPSTAFWDTSEYIATAHILGLPHPPGNPFFVLFGKGWLLLTGWTGLEVATRINLLSATVSAAAAVFWFLAVMRIWAHFTENRAVALMAAFCAVLVSGTAYTVWAQSNVNEKVYTVSLLFVAAISYLAMLWEDHSDTYRGDRLMVLIAFLLGLGSTNHQMSLLPLPALAAFVFWHNHGRLLNWKSVAIVAGGLVVGVGLGAALQGLGWPLPRLWLYTGVLAAVAVVLSPRVAVAGTVFLLIGFSVQLLFVPIRSAQNPIIDEADPECVVIGEDGLASNRIIDAVIPKQYETGFGEKKLAVQCEKLAASIAREQYQKPPWAEEQSPRKAQFAMFWQYFDWQWARTLPVGVRGLVTMLFLAFGIIGLVRHARGDMDSFVYFATFLATITVLLIFYLNFKYGYSTYGDIPLDRREVRERDYFYVFSFNVWGLYAGMGIVTVWKWIGNRFAAAGDPNRGLRLASPMLSIAFLPLIFNFALADRRGDYSARDWAWNILQSIEPYGVVFTNGDNDTFPLWYLQEVEGIRRDVTVIVHSYLGTKWYPKQLRDLTAPCPEGVDPLDTPTVVTCQRPFDRENAIDLYRDWDITPPQRAIHSLSDARIDSLPIYQPIPAGTTVQFTPNITVQFDRETFLMHPDFLVWFIVQESLGDRPIYFAATAPPVYEQWNLGAHLIRHGLAHKLVEDIEPTENIVLLDPQFIIRWVDVERTEHLLWDVFRLDYLFDWKLWPEPSTRASIPAQYYIAHIALAAALDYLERPEDAEAAAVRGERLLELSGRVIP